jgi:hypothetical protein
MKFLFPADKVKLKDGVLRHLEIGEWEIQKIERGCVKIKHPQFKYTLGVKEDDIEWDSLKGE